MNWNCHWNGIVFDSKDLLLPKNSRLIHSRRPPAIYRLLKSSSVVEIFVVVIPYSVVKRIFFYNSRSFHFPRRMEPIGIYRFRSGAHSNLPSSNFSKLIFFFFFFINGTRLIVFSSTLSSTWVDVCHDCHDHYRRGCPNRKDFIVDGLSTMS